MQMNSHWTVTPAATCPFALPAVYLDILTVYFGMCLSVLAVVWEKPKISTEVDKKVSFADYSQAWIFFEKLLHLVLLVWNQRLIIESALQSPQFT